MTTGREDLGKIWRKEKEAQQLVSSWCHSHSLEEVIGNINTSDTCENRGEG